MAPIIVDLNIKIHFYHRSQVATSAYFSPQADTQPQCSQPLSLCTHGMGINPWKVSLILEDLGLPYTTPGNS